MKIKDIINLRRIKMAGDKQLKAKPKAKPKTELKEETHSYPRPFEVTGTGILFPDGTVQNSAQGGSAEIDPKLVTQLQQNTADIAKNAEDIAAIEIPEMPEIPDPIDAYTKAEVDSSQGAQDTKIAKNAGDIAAIESSTLSLQEKIQKLEQQVRELKRVDKK